MIKRQSNVLSPEEDAVCVDSNLSFSSSTALKKQYYAEQFPQRAKAPMVRGS